MKSYDFNEQATEVDIALILESSYPYILGGVSAWVHQIIENFPNYNFGLIFLGGSPENYKEGIRYAIPKNVKHFQVHYLFADDDPPPPKITRRGNAKGFDMVKKMHDTFKCPHVNALEQMGDITEFMNGIDGVSYEDFLYSKLSWDLINEQYTKQCEDSSYIDYFWTIRNLHKPLWKIVNVLKNFPKAKAVHTVSTGYAGLLSFLIHKRFQYPVILTEHGIYTKERKIDIFLSQIIREDADRSITDVSYLRTLWDRYFRTMSVLSYHVANPIVGLFNQAHQIQLEEGADPTNALVIPNGIDIERFKKLRRPLSEKMTVIACVGRIVPMKDVKGFIRTVPNLHKHIPDLKVWVIGSTDQDPIYAQECVELVENVLLQDVIEFKPHMSMEEVLPKIKILVLNSIREGMPLVLLESFGAGVPVVCTDVGACKEMVESQHDNIHGPAGKIVKVADSASLEKSIVEILSNETLWNQMSESGIKRAEKIYDQDTLIEKYRQIYERTIT